MNRSESLSGTWPGATRPRRMSLRDVVEMAVFAVRGNWLRSVLTALGVIIGIALGIGGTMLAERFIALPIELSAEVILLATGFAIATGLFFGYYPAHKASRLDPIEALRHQG